MFEAKTTPGFFAVPPTSRLRWLVRLRWLALLGVAVGLGVAQAARFAWVSAGPIAIALAVGVLYNLAFLVRLRRLEHSAQRALRAIVDAAGSASGQADADVSVSTIRALAEVAGTSPERSGRRGLWYLRRIGDRLRGRDVPGSSSSPSIKTDGTRELELQALADVGALTLLLLASGGVRNPISMFFGFHVVIGAMLGYFRGALFAAAVGLLGIGLLVVAEHFGWLLSQALTAPPLWLTAGAAVLTVACLAYFALGMMRFVEREQGRALRNYDLLLAALDTLHVGLELVDPDGRLLLANRRAATLHPCADGQWKLPAGLAASSGDDGQPRRLAHTEAGEARIYEMLALSGWGADGVRAFIYVDRTEATVNEQRAIMLEQLASLGRAMQQVAHELNTPLASIQTLAVDLSHAKVDSDSVESIQLIIDEARRCREISRELLSTARLGSHTPVHTVVAEVVRRAARLAYGRQPGRASVNLVGDLDASCVTDGDRLLQILVNLLQNARDASDQSVEVSLHDSTEQVLLTVRDRGPGLSESVRARLFEPFVSTKPPGKGTGLGLYTCARLAHQLRAELTVQNAEGGGVVARLALLKQAEIVTASSS